MSFDTPLEAVREWVKEFNAIPMGVIEKLAEANQDDLMEITPAYVGARVYVNDGDYADQEGDAVKRTEEGSLIVKLDSGVRTEPIPPEFLVPQFDDRFPIWGTMWSFGDGLDNDWLSGRYGQDGLQIMADCGFRVYESEDYEYVFGIDGAGYDFYSEHWLPLYRVRGLCWHKDDAS